MARIILLSHLMDGNTPLYGGEDRVEMVQGKSIKSGDSCNTMRLSMTNHAGTHVDMPRHFFEKGATVSDMPPEGWVFDRITLVEVPSGPGESVIGPDLLEEPVDCELLLIRTGMEKFRNEKTYIQGSPVILPELADWIKSKCPSIKAVGIDTISISSLNDRVMGRKAHKAFLEKGIILVEDMKLSGVGHVPDRVIVAPLMLKDADAAPVTVFGFSYV
ncbi:MAG: cyclase family protein [Candidatus Omnitrophica bacterium]|nr:cyclase family protein [Candidatus Omnitrophota bacterium]MDD5488841.1 cyclase family protein [Candidatus Omnitrophota bacterium]